jgi:hypothetical protein
MRAPPTTTLKAPLPASINPGARVSPLATSAAPAPQNLRVVPSGPMARTLTWNAFSVQERPAIYEMYLKVERLP